jgi:hypothetical protein
MEHARPTFSFRKLILLWLPILSLTAVYCCWYISFHNGFFLLITEIFLQSPQRRLFPGTEQHLVQNYTGLKPLDKQLAVLVIFFTPVVELNSKPLALFVLWAFGQFVAAWTLLFMESLRWGNRRNATRWYILSTLINTILMLK